eukprot:GFUD01081092.1.p1 GENE.GFUD01081092.1~~GFUD01081092.1.p1  ORF type:complete len:109 (+),score=14.15 GFUD01081092.1:90-416(+)
MVASCVSQLDGPGQKSLSKDVSNIVQGQSLVRLLSKQPYLEEGHSILVEALHKSSGHASAPCRTQYKVVSCRLSNLREMSSWSRDREEECMTTDDVKKDSMSISGSSV